MTAHAGVRVVLNDGLRRAVEREARAHQIVKPAPTRQRQRVLYLKRRHQSELWTE